MPRITTVGYRIDGEYHQYDLCYNQKKLFHITGFPEHVLRVMDNSCVSGFKSEAELNTAMYVMLKAYHEQVKKTRKVIVYSLQGTNALVMNKSGDNGYEGFKKWVPEKLRAMDFGSDMDGYGFAIDWTQEREEALNAIGRAMEDMIKKIAKLMGDADTFTKLLDSGANLLTAGSREEK